MEKKLEKSNYEIINKKTMLKINEDALSRVIYELTRRIVDKKLNTSYFDISSIHIQMAGKNFQNNLSSSNLITLLDK